MNIVRQINEMQGRPGRHKVEQKLERKSGATPVRTTQSRAKRPDITLLAVINAKKNDQSDSRRIEMIIRELKNVWKLKEEAQR